MQGKEPSRKVTAKERKAAEDAGRIRRTKKPNRSPKAKSIAATSALRNKREASAMDRARWGALDAGVCMAASAQGTMLDAGQRLGSSEEAAQKRKQARLAYVGPATNSVVAPNPQGNRTRPLDREDLDDFPLVGDTDPFVQLEAEGPFREPEPTQAEQLPSKAQIILAGIRERVRAKERSCLSGSPAA